MQSVTGNNWVGKDMPFDLTHRLREGQNTLRLVQKGCACVSNYLLTGEDKRKLTEKGASLIILVFKSTLVTQRTISLILSRNPP